MERVRIPFKNGPDVELPYSIGFSVRPHDIEKCVKCQCYLFRYHVKVLFPTASKLFHVNCFFNEMARGTNVISLDLVRGIDEMEPDDLKKFLTKLENYQRELEGRKHKIAAGLFQLARRPAPDVPESGIDVRTVLDLAHCRVEEAGESMKRLQLPHLNCLECNGYFYESDVAVECNEHFFHFKCSLEMTDVIVGRPELMHGWEEIHENSKNHFREQLNEHLTKLGKNDMDRSVSVKFQYRPELQPLIFSTAHVFTWSSKVNVTCHSCSENIHKNQTIFFLGSQSASSVTFPNLLFSHAHCAILSAKQCYDTPEEIPGFWNISEDDRRHLIMQYHVALQNGILTALTLPREINDRKGKDISVIRPEISEDLEAQLVTFCSLRRQYLNMPRENIESILFENSQNTIGETDELVSRLVDISLFGVPEPCPICLGAVTYRTGRRTYACSGFSTPYSKCSFESKNPKRTEFLIPDVLEDKDQINCAELNTLEQRLYLTVNGLDGNPREKNEIIFPDEFQNSKVPKPKINRAVNNPDHCSKYLIKNGTAVPSISQNSNNTHIMRDPESDKLFDAFLTSVECQENRNTSVHLMILEEDYEERYHFMKIISRLGTTLLSKSEHSYEDRDEVIGKFSEEFWNLTGTCWIYRDRFKKKPGKYQWVELWIVPEDGSCNHRYSQIERKMLEELDADREDEPSKLDYREISSKHQYVGGLISDKSKQFLEKMLGELKEKIMKETASRADFIDATNTVYSLLPTNFGFWSVNMVRNMSDIEDVMKALNSSSQVSLHNDHIPCGIDFPMSWKSYQYLEHVGKSTEDWRIIEKYLKNTKGVTHRNVSDVELIDVLKIKRPKKSVEHHGGSLLLWHGTNKENLGSIFDKGLLKNPGVHVQYTGSMFGKGVYFADCFSKSFNYARNYGDGDVYMFLCQVQTGAIFHSWQPIYEGQVEKELETGKFNSIKGNGRFVPNPNEETVLNGAQVPYGKLQELTVQDIPGRILDYNEYVVYDEDRITLRYLVRVKCFGNV